MMRTGITLEKVFNPAKINFEIQGNKTPHLHCHIKPRYLGDVAPEIPIDQNFSYGMLSDEEYDIRIKLIRNNLYVNGK